MNTWETRVIFCTVCWRNGTKINKTFYVSHHFSFCFCRCSTFQCNSTVTDFQKRTVATAMDFSACNERTRTLCEVFVSVARGLEFSPRAQLTTGGKNTQQNFCFNFNDPESELCSPGGSCYVTVSMVTKLLPFCLETHFDSKRNRINISQAPGRNLTKQNKQKKKSIIWGHSDICNFVKTFTLVLRSWDLNAHTTGENKPPTSSPGAELSWFVKLSFLYGFLVKCYYFYKFTVSSHVLGVTYL